MTKDKPACAYAIIRKGLLEQKYGQIYQSLYEKHVSEECDDFVYNDGLIYSKLYRQASEFVELIKKMTEG